MIGKWSLVINNQCVIPEEMNHKCLSCLVWLFHECRQERWRSRDQHQDPGETFQHRVARPEKLPSTESSQWRDSWQRRRAVKPSYPQHPSETLQTVTQTMIQYTGDCSSRWPRPDWCWWPPAPWWREWRRRWRRCRYHSRDILWTHTAQLAPGIYRWINCFVFNDLERSEWDCFQLLLSLCCEEGSRCSDSAVLLVRIVRN